MADTSVSQLNNFLRLELAAIEAYAQTLDHIDDVPARATLLECQRSHEERAERLRARIAVLGGQPVATSGPWGVLARILERGAVAIGERVAIAALEEGEDIGLRDYTKDLTALDADSRALVEHELLPRQVKTHRAMSGLKSACTEGY